MKYMSERGALIGEKRGHNSNAKQLQKEAVKIGKNIVARGFCCIFGVSI